MEQFEVIFYDEDKTTILDKQTVNKNEKVTYKGKTPAKEIENGVEYVFDGWIGEEKLEDVQENLTLVAKYKEETSKNILEDALYNATLETAKSTDINATVSASQKISNQIKMLEKDSRSAEEIVNAILKDGKAEIAVERDDQER